MENKLGYFPLEIGEEEREISKRKGKAEEACTGTEETNREFGLGWAVEEESSTSVK